MPIKTGSKRVSQTKKTQEALSQASPIQPMVPKKYVFGVIALLAILGILYLNKGFFVAALVNGQPVTRLSVINELERQGGKQTLNTLVTKTLILQEANKQRISVNKQEIDGEIKKIEESVAKQGQNLDQLLTLQGMSRQSLVEQIRLQKLIEKMAGKNISISDKEVGEYIEKNKESLGSTDDQTELRKSVKEQLKQEKLSKEYQVFIEKLQKQAKISYFVY